MLNYKKPAFWIITVAVAACLVVGVWFLTAPKSEAALSEMLSYDYRPDGVWTYLSEDYSVSSSFLVNSDRTVTGVISKNKETTDFSISYRMVKGSEKKAVCEFYACSPEIADTVEGEAHFMFEARMKAKNGRIQFAFPDQNGADCFGKKKVQFVLRASENNNSQLTENGVQIIAMNSGTTDSSYHVAAVLSGTAFSSVSRTLEDKIAQEWDTYDGMTKEVKMLSSHLWGIVNFETDTWDEFEEAVGFTVNNPLESLSWLNKTGYIGMESTDPNTPIKHVEITANTANAERKLSEISAASGYNTESTRITLTAVLSSNAGTYTTCCSYNGNAKYEQETAATDSGIPVLIVITDGTNNTGYYNGDYYDPTAYWVKDNVFYTLRVTGDSADKAEIQATLDRILEGI